MPIMYERFFKTLNKKGLSQYKFQKDNNISPSLMTRLRNNMPLRTTTIENICKILDCNVEDILEYRKDPTEEENE